MEGEETTGLTDRPAYYPNYIRESSTCFLFFLSFFGSIPNLPYRVALSFLSFFFFFQPVCCLLVVQRVCVHRLDIFEKEEK